MIVNYTNNYFEYLKKEIIEFQIDYLKKENPFLKNYVYIQNDVPVGMISYSLIYDRIELEYIWTDKKYRKKGIASKLMDKMFEENASNITFEVRTTNQSAINLYKKYGFKIVSTRKNYYGREDAYLMIREMM